MTKSRKLAAFAVIVFFLSAVSLVSRAQEEEEDDENPHIFYAGFVLGSNFTQIDGDNFAGYHKVGLNVGGIGYAQLRKHLALSYEILYSQKGSKSDITRYATDSNIVITKYDIKLNYAEIPIMINYFDSRKSHFGIGLSYSQLVSSSESLTTIPATNIDLTKYPFKKQNLDFLVGAQLHLYKGFFLNFRFQYSITPVRSNVPPDFSRSQEYSNMFAVRLMYLFI